MIWVIGAGLVLAILVLLLRPLLSASTALPLSPFDGGQEDEARTAAARRLLAEAEAQNKARPLGRGARNAVIALVALAVPALGIGLYGMVGHPQDIGVLAPPQPNQELADLAALADQLGARLAEQGADAPAQGWALYARTLHQLGQYDAAASAFGQAAARDPQKGLYLAGQAEAMVFAAGGQMTVAAAALFQQILAASPADPSARYYLALADLQAGRAEAAYSAFRTLAAATDPTAPYFVAVQDRLGEAALAAGKPVPERAGPSADDVAAAADMSAEDRMAMIRSMVDGLAARLEVAPDDLGGWRRLAGARTVLQEWAAAAAAHLQVLRLSPGDDTAISGLKALYPRLASGPLKDRVAAQIQ